MSMSAASFGWGFGHEGMEMFFNFGPWLMIGWLWSLLPFILIGLVAYWLIERDRDKEPTNSRSGGGRGGSDALSTLEKRYAAGEIGREEYLRIREDLTER